MTIKKVFKIIGVSLLVLITAPLLIGQFLRLVSSDVPPAGELVDVGGYKLHINCKGPTKVDKGLPTVIIEAGAGTPSPTYHWLQKGIAETTKVCVYDRAGLAWSEESDLPRDSDTITAALNTLLDKSNIKRPFVFAGHSIAGLYMRRYVDLYPGEVAGMIFLDASHPRQNKAFGVSKENTAKQTADLAGQLTLVKWMINLGFTEMYNPMVALAPDFQGLPEDIQKQADYVSTLTRYLNAAPQESGDFEAAALQAAQNTTLGDIPIVVISATEPVPEGVLPDYFPDDFQAIFVNLHKEITALSTNGRHVEIDTANHMSLVANKDQVEKTLPYIREVILEAAKSQEQ